MKSAIFATALVLGALLAFPAQAGCYSCGSDQCCQDAEKGQTGSEVCTNDRICVGAGCTCNDCFATGGNCQGTAKPKCEKALENCEENRAQRIVPHGEPVDLHLLTAPANPSTFATSVGCGSEA